MVLSRRFTASEKTVEFVQLPFQWSDFVFNRQLSAARLAMSRFDDWLSEVCEGAPFSLYLPHYEMPQYQLMATHRECREVSYLEEGSSAYLTDVESERRRRYRGSRLRDIIIGSIGYSGRVSRRARLFQEPYRACYAINSDAFPGRSCVTALPAVFSARTVGADTDDRVIALALRKGFSTLWPESSVIEVVEALSSVCKAMGVGLVCVKPHPGESDHGSILNCATRTLRSLGIDVRVLAQDCYLEGLLESKSTIAVTMGSSLELYSNFFAGRVIMGLALRHDRQVSIGEYLAQSPRVLSGRLEAVADASIAWYEKMRTSIIS